MTEKKPGNLRLIIPIVTILVGYLVAGVWWGATVSAQQDALKNKHSDDMTAVKGHIKEIKVRQEVFDNRQIYQGQLLVEIKTLIKRGRDS